MKSIYRSGMSRRKRRTLGIVMLVLFLISGTIIVALLLGSKAGSFVIRVQDGTVNKSIMITETNPDLDVEGENLTKVLSAPGVANFTDYSPSLFLQDGFDTINEYTKKGGAYYHQDEGSIALYCYTFYVVNTGGSSVYVNLAMDYSTNGTALDDIVRVMSYTADSENKEVARIYQKPDNPVASYPYYPKGIPLDYFYNDSIIFNNEKISVPFGGYVKYSILFWLEGDDPDSVADAERFYNATIKFNLKLSVSMD